MIGKPTGPRRASPAGRGPPRVSAAVGRTDYWWSDPDCTSFSSSSTSSTASANCWALLDNHLSLGLRGVVSLCKGGVIGFDLLDHRLRLVGLQTHAGRSGLG